MLDCFVCSSYVRDVYSCFFFQAEDGIRDLVRSRGLGDVYKRQVVTCALTVRMPQAINNVNNRCLIFATLFLSIFFLSLIHI